MLGTISFHILWTSRSSFSPCPYGIVVVVFHFDSGGRKAKKKLGVWNLGDLRALLRLIGSVLPLIWHFFFSWYTCGIILEVQPHFVPYSWVSKRKLYTCAAIAFVLHPRHRHLCSRNLTSDASILENEGAKSKSKTYLHPGLSIHSCCFPIIYTFSTGQGFRGGMPHLEWCSTVSTLPGGLQHQTDDCRGSTAISSVAGSQAQFNIVNLCSYMGPHNFFSLHFFPAFGSNCFAGQCRGTWGTRRANVHGPGMLLLMHLPHEETQHKFVQKRDCVNVRGNQNQDVISRPKIQRGSTTIAQVKSKPTNPATPHAHSHFQYRIK